MGFFVYVAWIKCPYKSSLSEKEFIWPTVLRYSLSIQWSPYGGSLGSWSHWTHCHRERGTEHWKLVPSELLTASYSPELDVREWGWQLLTWFLLFHFNGPNHHNSSQTRPRAEEFITGGTRSMSPMGIPYPVNLTLSINLSEEILWLEEWFEVCSFPEISLTKCSSLKPRLKF